MPSKIDRINKLAPGSRSNFSLLAGPYWRTPSAIRSVVEIPVTLVRGAKDGPTFCVIAGVHGTEYAGIGAAIRLSTEVDPQTFAGNLAIVRVANMPAFYARSYICPIDGVNLQGNWPGNKGGTIAHLIARKIFDELIGKSDYFVDLHGGDLHESEVGFSIFYKTGKKEVDEMSERIARALGFDYVMVAEGGEFEGYSWRVAPEHGIPSGLCELGQGDRLLPDEVDTVFNGLVNVLRAVGMLGGEVQSRAQTIVKWLEMRAERPGLLYPRVRPGDPFSKGMLLAEVKSLEGEVVQRIIAQERGVVLALITNPMVEVGENVLVWSRVED